MKLERTALFCASINAAGTRRGRIGEYWSWTVPWSDTDFFWHVQYDSVAWLTGWRMNEVEVWQ